MTSHDCCPIPDTNCNDCIWWNSLRSDCAIKTTAEDLTRIARMIDDMNDLKGIVDDLRESVNKIKNNMPSD